MSGIYRDFWIDKDKVLHEVVEGKKVSGHDVKTLCGKDAKDMSLESGPTVRQMHKGCSKCIQLIEKPNAMNYIEIKPDKTTLPKDKQKVIFKFSKGGIDYLLKGEYHASEEHFYISKKERKGHGLKTNFFFWFEVIEWKPVNKPRQVRKKVTVSDLLKVGIELRVTKLGAKVFWHKDNRARINRFLCPDEWSVDQLRVIADYMEAHPECALMSDGSGSPVRMKHSDK